MAGHDPQSAEQHYDLTCPLCGGNMHLCDCYKRYQRGWTLPELLYVVAILAFFSASLWVLIHFVRKFW